MVQPTTEGELAGQTKINFQTALFKDNHLSDSRNKGSNKKNTGKSGTLSEF